LLKLRDSEHVTWHGTIRAPLRGQGVYPRPIQNPLPVWIAVGGTPQSVVRAAKLGLPMALAIIGGAPERFAPVVDLYRDTARQAGRDPATLPVSINSHVFVADDSQEASDVFYPAYAEVMTRIGRERGWPPLTRQQFEAGRTLRGALAVGSPQQVIDKIPLPARDLRPPAFLAQVSGVVPHARMMRHIELLGTEVAPVVRREVEARVAAP
jgi:alkanesulfonate monooxygenase SsuD/methylene tetrahydromethanopterin reductase-like flavin-dependent oxidoreductase (luciferase family)